MQKVRKKCSHLKEFKLLEKKYFLKKESNIVDTAYWNGFDEFDNFNRTINGFLIWIIKSACLNR